MIGSKRGIRRKRKGSIYFNFSKFERLLDELRRRGENVTSIDFSVKRLKDNKSFKYFFDNFSDQQIKTQLIFYGKQFEEGVND